jgi:uncharacterized RDD family membrane protein YckC
MRLGLPARGPRSVAGFGPRTVAFLVDAVLCNLLAAALTLLGVSLPHGTLVLWIYLVEVAVLTWLGGASAGHRVVGLRVVRLDGAPPGLLAALIRTAGLGLLFPALIWDRDHRGLHDKAAGTVLIHAR